MAEVLFISHDAFRGGATLFLLNVQRWLRENTDLRFVTLLARQGEMEAAFRELGPVVTIEAPRLHQRALAKLGRLRGAPAEHPQAHGIRRASRQLRAKHDIALIYSNTAINGWLLPAFDDLRVPVLSHIHELESAIQLYGVEDFRRVIERTTRYVAVSQGVRDNLLTTHGIAGERVALVPGFVPTSRALSAPLATLRERVRGELGVPADALLVGCCGVADHRKGVDLLSQLALVMPPQVQGRPVHFVWIGAFSGGPSRFALEQDAQKAGVAQRVHFAGMRKDSYDWIASLDAFALLSREDAFPLVMMEAAVLGVPLVAFENTGGADEFCAGDAGLLVSYLQLAPFAAALVRVLEDLPLRERLTRAARDRVQTRHDSAVVVPQLLDAINQTAGRTLGRRRAGEGTAEPVP